MLDESEVIQADVGMELELPNGAKLRGKPVSYFDARRIMALLHTFDRTGDYEQTMVPALEQFSQLTGITDDMIMQAYPEATLGDVTTAVQRFFFLRHRNTANGAAKRAMPESTRARPGEPGA